MREHNESGHVLLVRSFLSSNQIARRRTERYQLETCSEKDHMETPKKSATLLATSTKPRHGEHSHTHGHVRMTSHQGGVVFSNWRDGGFPLRKRLDQRTHPCKETQRTHSLVRHVCVCVCVCSQCQRERGPFLSFHKDLRELRVGHPQLSVLYPVLEEDCQHKDEVQI